MNQIIQHIPNYFSGFTPEAPEQYEQMKLTDAEKWRWFVDTGFLQTRIRYIADLSMDGKYPCFTGWTPKYGQIQCKTIDELVEKAMEEIEE